MYRLQFVVVTLYTWVYRVEKNCTGRNNEAGGVNGKSHFYCKCSTRKGALQNQYLAFRVSEGKKVMGMEV